MTMTLTRQAPKAAARPMIGHKTFLLEKASIDANGTLSGYGAIFGNLDDGGDIIEPGFFAPVLDDFLREGFIAWNHDWGNPVAMPTKAAEDEVGLAIATAFHSTPGAQEKRTIAQERLAAGMAMGLSIGYEIAPGGATYEKDGRHLRKASRLFEVSLVMVPMNREAGATDVKTMTPDSKSASDNVSDAAYCLMWLNRLIESEAQDAASGDDDAADDANDVALLTQARDFVLLFMEAESAEVGSPGDLADIAEEEAAAAAWAEQYYGYGYMGRTIPFADQLSTVTTAVKATSARARALAKVAKGRKEGRVISSSNRDRLEALRSVLADAEKELDDLLASADSEKSTGGVIDAEYELTRARLAGVLI
jgi:HK97 family phage prohead protease